MSLDFLFATPSDFEAHLAAGLMPDQIAALYSVPVRVIMALDFFKSRKAVGGFRARPAHAFGEPVSILDLRPTMCAVVVDHEAELPHYCGAPATHRWRFCAEHARTHVTKG